ncbi:MAG: hypothetical protein C4538_08545 [Nitrospiraceae bacterium]|nr:MAG: hypothetical protein C4538_08545 [Nitrospiraceae bacterium]
MRKITALSVVVLFIAAALIINKISNSTNTADETVKETPAPAEQEKYRVISGVIKKGETFLHIFKKYALDVGELFQVREAAADVHRLRDLRPGQEYKIILDENDRIASLEYCINDDAILSVKRTESGFCAEKQTVVYEEKIQHISGVIKDNLVSSMGEGRENLILALQLSDIFAWDIDFTTDLRKGDMYKIVAKAFYLDGEFKKFGEVVSAEFVNNGKTHHAYRFALNGKADYFDDEGRSLKKAFLKAPLNFRRISSTFSKGRFHPILKTYRPHHGLDYAAPTGTPVSSVGDGTVVFSGRKGQYGNLVSVKHRNGYVTRYGHLSRIGKNIRNGARVEQGEIIGYVGSTGLATGPHLHYEIRINNRAVNPLTVELPRGESIPRELRAEFTKFRNSMITRFALITPPVFASSPEMRDNNI